MTDKLNLLLQFTKRKLCLVVLLNCKLHAAAIKMLSSSTSAGANFSVLTNQRRTSDLEAHFSTISFIC